MLRASTEKPSTHHSLTASAFAHSLPEARAISPLSALCQLLPGQGPNFRSASGCVAFPGQVSSDSASSSWGLQEKYFYISLSFFFFFLNQLVNKGLVVTRLSCGLWGSSEPWPWCSAAPLVSLPEVLVSMKLAWVKLTLPHSVLTIRVGSEPSPFSR